MLLAAACQQAEQTEATADVSEKASGVVPAAVGELRNAWIAASERDDAASVAAMYTEDAIFMTSDGATLNGRAEIEAGLAESFKAGSGLTVTEESAETSGDVVYSTGEWKQKITMPDGKSVDAEGRYLVISKLQADGTWKITRHVSILKAPSVKS
ncbi:MAG TPA: SgcJ/EcaC family oxidoreductase [Longimicrobiales bacterium]